MPMPRFAIGRPRLAERSVAFADQMRARFGAERLRAAVPLAPFTTFKVGGPAEWFVETTYKYLAF